MRVLIDECLDWRLGRDLGPDHECTSVQRMGWSGLRNGELLARTQRDFEVFLTSDQNLSFQQNVMKFDIVIVVLSACGTRLVDTRPLMPAVAEKIRDALPGTAVMVELDPGQKSR